MQQYLSVFQACPLFQGIPKAQLTTVLDCLSAIIRKFPQNSPILHAGDKMLYIGIILEGAIQIERSEANGERTIVEKFHTGNLFGEALACAGISHSPFTIMATQPSTILFIQYTNLLHPHDMSCSFHTILIQNMIRTLASKNVLLNQKLSHLSKRSTREKLLSYLNSEAKHQNSNNITIPYNRQELADYLCVERSAMSAELARMKQDGLILYHKNHFTLLSITPTYG